MDANRSASGFANTKPQPDIFIPDSEQGFSDAAGASTSPAERCEDLRRRLLWQNSRLEKELLHAQTQVQLLTLMWRKATRWKRLLAFAALAPVDWFLGLLFVGAELGCRLHRNSRPPRRPLFPLPRPQCSFIVVSWNAKDLLQKSLPALLNAIRRHNGAHEIIVVDNASIDGTAEFMQSQFPQVRLVRTEKSLSFCAALELGVENAGRDILVFLSNDMIADPEFIAPLLQPFSNPDTFGVACRVDQSNENHTGETGRTHIHFNGCDFDCGHAPISAADERTRTVPVGWLHSTATAIDRSKYLWLRRLDQTLDHLSVEDVDLSYAAWKVGWQCLLAKQSRVSYAEDTSAPGKGAADDFVKKVILRNHYTFVWKNITDIRLLATHFVRCAAYKMRRAGDPGIGIHRQTQAWKEAIGQVPKILVGRWRLGHFITRSDREVFRLIKGADNKPAVLRKTGRDLPDVAVSLFSGQKS